MFNYTLKRSRRKTVAIYVRNGAVEVRAPLNTSQAEIDRILRSNQETLEKSLAQSVAKRAQRANFRLAYGDKVLYRGGEYPITARAGNLVGFDAERGEFFIPPNLVPENIKAAVVQIYKMLAESYIVERVKHFQPIMRATVSGFRITNAKKRWGSLNSRHSVSFSWMLIMAADDLIDQVVVHELAHTKQFNHSREFWAVVAQVIPDWRQREARLKELSEKIRGENWDINWLAAAHEERASFGEIAAACRWHFADYKTILSPKNSMNIYRGCLHNCVYCDSRSDTYNMHHDFEEIEVKRNAPRILEAQLRKRRSLCMIATGAMGDPYLPLEKDLQYTRQCLEVIEKHGFGVTVLTKSASVLRDLDVLKRINDKAKAVVQMTLTTFDEKLCRILEPDASSTAERFRALEICRDNGVPTVVWLCPLLPFINDTEENLRGILDYCVRAKVAAIMCFGFGTTMRGGSRDYFFRKLDEHFPGLQKKYKRAFGDAYVCPSPNEKELDRIFRETCDRHGIICDRDEVFAYLNDLPDKSGQLTLFDM